MIRSNDDDRAVALIARLRHRQLELASRGAVRESARIAARVERVRQAAGMSGLGLARVRDAGAPC